MSTLNRALFAGLVDDAAMFPPGNASPEVALAEHLRIRGSWFAGLVGPLLVPSRSFEAFVDAHTAAGSPDVAIVLIGTTTLPDVIPAGMTLVGFEVSVAEPPLPAVPHGMSLAAEIRPGPPGERVLDAVADGRGVGRDVVGKFRTGGTTSDAFPSEDVLAAVIVAANAVSAPLKLTAGLHHAVRFTDRATGFEHHGFLNVLVAASKALAGAGHRSVAEVLSTRSAAPLVDVVRTLGTDQVTGVRSRFVSFGCCGVEDPVNDLVGLGLVEERR